jgi:hypothetical protein
LHLSKHFGKDSNFGVPTEVKVGGLSGLGDLLVGASRRYHPPTAQTPFPLNLDFGDLNATKSKN